MRGDLIIRGTSALVVGILLAACGSTGPTRLKMKFDVSRKANDDNPVQVDVVVAFDPDLVDELDRLTANEWFAQREQRMRNNPGQTAFNAWRWELTPGVEVPSVELSLPGKPAQGLLFADYHSRGKHSARFDPRLAQTVLFRADAFRVVHGKVNDPDSGGWRPPVGWSTVGIGLVGLGLGTTFGILADGAANDTRGLTEKDEDKHARLVDDYDDYRTGMWISVGIGSAFLIAGAAILLWPETNESPFREIPDEGDEGANAAVITW